MEDENEFTEHEIVPDKSVWRFATAMGVLVLLLALLNIFSEDIHHLLNPPQAPAPSAGSSAQPVPARSAASDSESLKEKRPENKLRKRGQRDVEEGQAREEDTAERPECWQRIRGL